MTANVPTQPPASSSASPPGRIDVLCVDDYPALTDVMRRLINAQPDMRCVGCLASADELANEVRRLCTHPLPGPAPTENPTTNPTANPASNPVVVILDATMPGKNPFDAVRELAAAFPHVKTIMYSGHNDRGMVDRAIDAGAWGCAAKGMDPTQVLHAVREVVAGRVVFPGCGKM
jgi:DNA-binding NarL/FixJ family response regulator